MMDGHKPESTHILTQYESYYGSIPKVQFRKNQVITNIIPDFGWEKWLGFRREIIDHHF
jgi:hypothetical protein